MKTLVTGANGFLGHYLVTALQERGHSVRTLILPNEDVAWLQKRQVTIYRGDVRRRETLTEPMQGVEVVFHLAAMMGVWRSMESFREVNVAGTENVCRAAIEAGVWRLVHVSSAMVYRMWVGEPATEEAPLTPLNEPYAVTKAEGDKLVQGLITRAALPAVIIRPGTIFGPGDRLNFGRLADRILAGKTIVIGSGRNAVPYVYVTDVVQGLLQALDAPQAIGQAYNIGNDEPLTQEQLLGAIADEIGARRPRFRLPYGLLYSIAYASERFSALSDYRIQPLVTRHGVTLYGANSRISIDKARRELGYAPAVALREGVRLTSAWYRKHRSRMLESARAAASSDIRVG